MTIEPPRKLDVSFPTFWAHHRGGWRRTVQVIDEQLGIRGGVRFVSAVEDELVHRGPVIGPWVGFVHQVPRQHSGFPDLERLVQMPAWRWSMPTCLGLWVLTEYQRTTLLNLGVDVPISLVRYPVELPVPSFRMAAFERSRRLLFVGEFLRDYQAFYDLPAPGLDKVLLAYQGFDPSSLRLEVNDSVTLRPRCGAAEYDRLLTESVVFLRLFDAVANTTTVECLARATPIVVNRVGAADEYLGSDYPLLYNSLEEAAEMVRDNGRILAAHEHLRDAPMRQEITEHRFVAALANTVVYRMLPTTPRQLGRFRQRDLTVLICTFKRIDSLAEQLDRFARQEWDGWFELLVWNNNFAERRRVDEIAAQFENRLDLSVVHSSLNYLGGVRLAVPSLMRSDLLLICDDDVLPEPGYLRAFMDRHDAYGSGVAIGARGHEFQPHDLDPDCPERVWEEGKHLRFFDESVEDRRVHFLHADNMLVSRTVLLDAARYPFPRPEYVLVDDYWLSFVLDHHLGVPLWKCRFDDVVSFTASSDDPNIALFHDPRVRSERVNFYVHHMDAGWPFPASGQQLPVTS